MASETLGDVRHATPQLPPPPLTPETLNHKKFFMAVKRRQSERREEQPLPAHVESILNAPVPDIEDFGGEVPETALGAPAELLDVEKTMKFAPGAIILLRLRNFQIAQNALYRFQPHLNLILGGNGTGKSAIINAIFLLFLGNLADLRQSSYGNFVQHGQPWGSVTALFQGVRGSYGNQNITLSMQISALKIHGNRSVGRKLAPQWFLNGEEVPVSRVWDLVCEFQIKVNNLCQFLPQFRVAAFSGETAQERLISTEDAIGYPGMVKDHEFLASQSDELNDRIDEITTLKKEISALRERKEALQRSVDTIVAAQKNEKELEVLEKVIDIAKYMDIEAQINRVKDELKQAENRLQEFDEETNESQFIDIINGDIGALDDRIAAMSQGGGPNAARLQKYIDNVTARTQRVDDCRARLKVALDTRRNKRAELKQCVDRLAERKVDLHKLQRAIHSEGSGSEEEFRIKASELLKAQSTLSERALKLREQKERVEKYNAIIIENEFELQRLQKQLDMLVNAPKYRSAADASNVIRGDRGSIARCLQIYTNAKDHFRQPIIPPAVMSVDIIDPRFVGIFSTVIRFVAIQRFICQNSEDQILFDQLAKQDPGARLNVSYMRVAPRAGKFHGKIDLLKSLGFDGVCIEKLKGPEPMMNYLKSLNLQDIPYSLSILTSQQVDKIRAYYESDVSGMDGNFSFVDPENHYRLLRSKFGRRIVTLIREKVSKPTPWAQFMLRQDTSAQQGKIAEKIAAKEGTIERSRSELELASGLVQEAEISLEEIRPLELKLREGIRNEKKLRDKHEVTLKSINSLEREISLINRAIESVGAEQKVKDLREAVTAVAHLEIISPADTLLRHISSEFDEKILKAIKRDKTLLISTIETKLRDARQHLVSKIEELQRKIDEINADTQHLHSRYEEAHGWLRAKRCLKESKSKASETSLTDLQVEYKQLAAQISLGRSAETLESAQSKLQQTSTDLEERELSLERNSAAETELTTSISSAKERYVKGLDAMIPKVNHKFSEMFRTTGCRGKVVLNKENDIKVATWGIDIYVSFREGEELTKLSRQRQSGGERAITTAFYLMALQDQANSPFRVLDEINQGMDESNERITMKFLVDFSCKQTAKAQQYFLVTPKLIPNIHTNPKMNVVLIMGGTSVVNTNNLIPGYDNTPRLEQLRKAVSDGIM